MGAGGSPDNPVCQVPTRCGGSATSSAPAPTPYWVLTPQAQAAEVPWAKIFGGTPPPAAANGCSPNWLCAAGNAVNNGFWSAVSQVSNVADAVNVMCYVDNDCASPDLTSWEKSQGVQTNSAAYKAVSIGSWFIGVDGPDELRAMTALKDALKAAGDDGVHAVANGAVHATAIERSTATTAVEQHALQTALTEGRVAATAPVNHLNGAMAEQLGWQEAQATGELGVAGPGMITATGPDYITYDLEAEQLNVYDAKFRSTGNFPSMASVADKLPSWMPQIASAVAGYTGPYAEAIQQAFDNGAITAQMFRYGGRATLQ